MAEIVLECKIKKEKGWLYFIDRNGNISRAKAQRGRLKGARNKGD